MFMSGSRIKYLNVSFLLIFLFTTLFINFFHIEKNLTEERTCPACNFLNSSLTTSQINFFTLPRLTAIGPLPTIYTFHYHYTAAINPLSRSPPQIEHS